MLPRPVFMTLSKVSYQEVIPGRRHFECGKLRGLISVEDCADRFDRSVTDPVNPERFTACMRCPVGVHHKQELTAGPSVEQIEAQPPVIRNVPGGGACVRCGGSGKRLVSRTLCISCWNRDREARLGRNARGNEPAFFKPVIPRRVGVLDDDGRPHWRLFPGQNLAEPIARAAREAIPMHGQHPGLTHWNSARQAFEYRDKESRVLLEMEIDDSLAFIAVDGLLPGEEPALVSMPTQSLSPEIGVLWFEAAPQEGKDLTAEWRTVPFSCGACGRGALQARRRGIEVQCRCTNCTAIAGNA